MRKICSYPGCNEISENLRCNKHTRKKDTRPSASARGYNYRWQKAAKEFLADHPICAHCGGLAIVVDHIQPHRGNQILFWDIRNWQPLCVGCHNIKSAMEKYERV